MADEKIFSDDFEERVKNLKTTEYRNEDYVPPEPDPTADVSTNPLDYSVPHKFMWMFRGVPMGQTNGHEMPVISLPPEAQHALAVHMELLGMEHNPDKQIIYSLPPEAGPDNPLNPGRWVRKKVYDEERAKLADMPGPEDDINLDDIGFSSEQLAGVELEHLEALSRIVDAAKMEKIKQNQADAHVTDTSKPADGSQSADSTTDDNTSGDDSSNPENASESLNEEGDDSDD